jgi:hypothetical protein
MPKRSACGAESLTGGIVLKAGALALGLALLLGVAACTPKSAGSTGAATTAGPSAAVTSVAGGAGTGSTSSPAATVTPPPPPPKPKPKPSLTANDVTHQATFIVKNGVSDSAYTLTLDYVQYLQGSAATKAAAAKGDTVENDYYVLNDNPKLRTFPVASGLTIIMHPGSGPQYHRDFTFSEFKTLMSSGSVTYGGKYYNWSNQMTFWVNVKNGKLTRIEQQWVP